MGHDATMVDDDRDAAERDRRPARQPQPAPARRLRTTEFDTPNLDRLARAVGALHQPPHRLAAVHAGPPRPARAARSTSCGGRGARSRCGRTPITHHAPPAPASRRCSSPTTRTCSRPAARTTTPTSARGTTCAATRATRGARRPTRRGSARRRCRPRRGAGSPPLRHDAARGSATRPTSRAHARWPRRPTWLDASQAPARTTAFLLFVDEFDPHEPFDTPEPWASPLRPRLGRAERLIWPPYAVDARRSPGRSTSARRAHIRGQLRRQAHR